MKTKEEIQNEMATMAIACHNYYTGKAPDENQIKALKEAIREIFPETWVGEGYKAYCEAYQKEVQTRS